MIVREHLHTHHCIVDIEYMQDDFNYTQSQLMLSYVEIGNTAYITLFPLEEGASNDLESSEAVSHLNIN